MWFYKGCPLILLEVRTFGSLRIKSPFIYSTEVSGALDTYSKVDWYDVTDQREPAPQEPPSMDACYDSVVDEPQLS